MFALWSTDRHQSVLRCIWEYFRRTMPRLLCLIVLLQMSSNRYRSNHLAISAIVMREVRDFPYKAKLHPSREFSKCNLQQLIFSLASQALSKWTRSLPSFPWQIKSGTPRIGIFDLGLCAIKLNLYEQCYLVLTRSDRDRLKGSWGSSTAHRKPEPTRRGSTGSTDSTARPLRYTQYKETEVRLLAFSFNSLF